MNEIKIKILDLRRRALAFASNGEMIERDPLLVKEIIRLLADLKREQELPIVVQKRTLPEDTGLASAGPSPKKQRGDVGVVFVSCVSEIREVLTYSCEIAGIRSSRT